MSNELGRLIESSFTKSEADDRNLTQAEKELLVEALQIRRNYIETGVLNLSAEEARRTGREDRVKLLTDAQTDFLAETKSI